MRVYDLERKIEGLLLGCVLDELPQLHSKSLHLTIKDRKGVVMPSEYLLSDDEILNKIMFVVEIG